jgi:hypothetical protein
MAKIKFGNIVVDMRGKISGNVYSKNKGGAYSRVRVVPSNPKSVAQSAVRAIFTILSQAWRGLTSTQRLSWNQGVGNFARKNSLGDSHNLSGNALFVSLNKNLADVSIAQNDECPAPQAVESVTVATAVADESSQSLIVTLTGAVPANTSLKVMASPTVSAGVNSIGTKMRQIGSFAAAHAAGLTLTTTYLAKFGVIGAAGSKIFVELVPVNETTGQVGAAIRSEIVITA